MNQRRASGFIQWIGTAVSVVIILAGVITFPLPIPIGLPLMLIGFSLLFRVSPRARRRCIRMARKNTHFAKILEKLR